MGRGKYDLIGTDQEVSVLRTGCCLHLNEFEAAVGEERKDIESCAVPLNLRRVHHMFSKVTTACFKQASTLALEDQEFTGVS